MLSLSLFPLAAAAGGGHSVIRNIALAMVAASVLGLVVKALKQPLILGYLLAGVLVGPIGLRLIAEREQVETLSEIGLILLLFMIGLEIDLKKMLSAGRLVVVTGAVQLPLTILFGWGVFTLVGTLGLTFGAGTWATLYLAVAIGISSTMIVVKLLYDTSKLDTFAGRITIGILVFQDLWAIVLLAVQPNLANPDLLQLARTFGAGALLVSVALGASRYVLPRLFQLVAKVPEMMLVLSLGWCFLVGLVAAHPSVGLSMEMGALIAGVSLATFPYNLDVIAKVLNIRDFFITLFFVSLGMQIPMPTVTLVLAAGVVSLILLGSRLVAVFGVLHALGAGHRSAILPAINLAQMSEFSLVILSIGVTLGHISRDSLSIALTTFALLAVLSTYLIGWSDPLALRASRVLARIGLRDLPPAEGEVAHRAPAVVMLGFFRIARAFVDELGRREQGLIATLKVMDFNPEVRERLASLGIPLVYGDISQRDTLEHAHIADARVVVSTVPDGALRGTTNLKLLKMARDVCPRARIIVTAEDSEQAVALYAEGADFVLQPSLLAGSTLVTVVEQALRGSVDPMREEAQRLLSQEEAAPRSA